MAEMLAEQAESFVWIGNWEPPEMKLKEMWEGGVW